MVLTWDGKVSIIDDETIQYYLDHELDIDAGDKSFTVRMGELSSDLNILMTSMKISSACVITAWNPRSFPTEFGINVAQQRHLHDDLNAKGFKHFPAYGRDRENTWHEEGFLVLGCDIASIIELCNKYDQNAVVWIDRESPAKIVLMR